MAAEIETTAFLCPQGHLRTDKPGKCPEHGTELKPATHRCQSCGYAVLKERECPSCKTRLQPTQASRTVTQL